MVQCRVCCNIFCYVCPPAYFGSCMCSRLGEENFLWYNLWYVRVECVRNTWYLFSLYVRMRLHCFVKFVIMRQFKCVPCAYNDSRNNMYKYRSWLAQSQLFFISLRDIGILPCIILCSLLFLYHILLCVIITEITWASNGRIQNHNEVHVVEGWQI
jgi:hypothetical protein